MSPRVNALQFGLNGATVVDDTTATPGEFGEVYVLNDAVISAITAPDIVNVSGITGITLPAETRIKGRIDSITLTSGVVIAYNR